MRLVLFCKIQGLLVRFPGFEKSFFLVGRWLKELRQLPCELLVNDSRDSQHANKSNKPQEHMDVGMAAPLLFHGMLAEVMRSRIQKDYELASIMVHPVVLNLYEPWLMLIDITRLARHAGLSICNVGGVWTET